MVRRNSVLRGNSRDMIPIGFGIDHRVALTAFIRMYILGEVQTSSQARSLMNFRRHPWEANTGHRSCGGPCVEDN